MLRFVRILMSVLVACALGCASSSAAPGAVVVATAYSYAPGGDRIAGGTVPASVDPVIVARGTDVLFVNMETLAPDVHSMTATACLDPSATCWFDTADPAPQSVGEAIVVPTSGLEPGIYLFYCVAHPVMQGSLSVV